MCPKQFVTYIIFIFLIFVDITYCLYNNFICPPQILGLFAVGDSNFWSSIRIPYEGPDANTSSRFYAPNQIFLEKTRSSVPTNRVVVSCVSITEDVLRQSANRNREPANIRDYKQERIYRNNRQGDHAGHIIAHKLGGSYHDRNIISQNPNCNTGYWREFIEGIINFKKTNYTNQVIYYGVKLIYNRNDKNDYPTRPEKLESKIFIQENGFVKIIASAVVENPPPSELCKVQCNDLSPVQLKYLENPSNQCKTKIDPKKCWAKC